MRRFDTPTNKTVKFAIGARSASWLTEVVKEFSQITVDGMNFAQALLPWSVALTSSIPVSIVWGHAGTFVTIAPKTTKAHGDEYIITASRDLLQVVIDMIAILVDGDRKEVQHLDHSLARKLHHHLCDWYHLEARLRSEMRTTYQLNGESASITVDVLTDDMLVKHIQDHPGIALQRLCEAFDIPWCVPPDEPPGYGYTPRAQELRRQLQRLRRTGQLTVDGGQRWHATPIVEQ